MTNMLIAVPLIIALTEIVKTAVPSLDARFFPLISLALAAIGGAIAVVVPDVNYIAEVLIAGLTASGLYSAGKVVLTGNEETPGVLR